MINETCIQYQISESNQLIYVNEAWQQAVATDGYPELQRNFILNRNLFEFIADSSTRMIYQDLLQRVRSGHLVSFSFRCDTPGQRRWMSMTIRRLEKGAVEFSTYILRRENRLPVPLLDSAQLRTGTFLHMCSWCKQIKIDVNQWVEVEEAVANLHLFEQPLLPELSHGICPGCLVSLKKTR